MPKFKVSLSIGISNAGQEDEIDIDDTEWDECENSEQRQDLMNSYWKDWSDNYIDGYIEPVDSESLTL